MENGKQQASQPVINFSQSSDIENFDAFNVSNGELHYRYHDGIDHLAELSDVTHAFNNLTANEREPPPPGLGNFGMEPPKNQPLTSEQVVTAFHQQQVAMEYLRACQMEQMNRHHSKELEERAGAAALMMQPAASPASWNGQIVARQNQNPIYSCKLFIGGIPYDVSERLLYDAFSPYGRCRIEWPGREPRIRMRGYSQRGKTVGYIYIVFEDDTSVKELLKHCEQLNENSHDLYFTLNLPSASGGNTRQVQVIPWVVSDANYVHDSMGKLDPKRTVFVGGLHGMITAEALFTIMNQTFGDVVYVGIDTDKHKYPIGSGRVTFSSYMAFFQAVSSAHLSVRTSKFVKRIQIDPFLEESLCMMCKKVTAPYFCRERNCFCYLCMTCWQFRHSLPSRMADHKALTRNIPRTANAFDSQPWLSSENSMIRSAMYGMAPPFEISHRNLPFGHAGFGTASSLAAVLGGGIDFQPYLWNLQTQTPPPINAPKSLFNFSGTMSTPSTPFCNTSANTGFTFPPPARFA